MLDTEKLVIQNSIENYKLMNEATTEADIASIESIIGKLVQDKAKSSLVHMISEVQPLTTAAGAIFTAQKNASGDIEIIKQPTDLKKDTGVTGFTKEVFDDINSMFGIERANGLIANMLLGVSNKEENTRLLSFLSANATAGTALTVEDGNSETMVFTTQNAVGKAIIDINKDTFKSLNGFAILPHSLAGAFLGFGKQGYGQTEQDKDLYIYKMGKITYFVNTDENDSNIYVGINGNTLGTSSIIFSPYQYVISKALQEDGSTKIFMINRSAITLNPLSIANSMLIKIPVTIS